MLDSIEMKFVYLAYYFVHLRHELDHSSPWESKLFHQLVVLKSIGMEDYFHQCAKSFLGFGSRAVNCDKMYRGWNHHAITSLVGKKKATSVRVYVCSRFGIYLICRWVSNLEGAEVVLRHHLIHGTRLSRSKVPYSKSFKHLRICVTLEKLIYNLEISFSLSMASSEHKVEGKDKSRSSTPDQRLISKQ